MLVTVTALDAPEIAASDRYRAVALEVYRDDPGWSRRSEDVIAERVEDAAAGRIEMRGLVGSVGGRTVARAAAIIEPDAVADNRPEGWIGLFECVPGHADAGAAVLRAAGAWLRERGRAEISAPRVDALRSGLVTEGFDEPQAIYTPYNPSYYPGIFSMAGLVPAATMLGFRFRASSAPHIRVPPGVGVRVRGVRLQDWNAEVAALHAFQETIFAGHVARVSRPLDATGLLARRLAPLIDPDLCLVAEDRYGEAVGFLLCLPDAWQARPEGSEPTRARLVSIGVRPGWRGRGAALAMGATLEKRLLAKGYLELEASWIFSNNARPQALVRALGAEPLRTATIYRALP